MKARFIIIIAAETSLIILLIVLLILCKQPETINTVTDNIETKSDLEIEETIISNSDMTEEASDGYSQSTDSFEYENTDEITETAEEMDTMADMEATKTVKPVDEADPTLDQTPAEHIQPIFESQESDPETPNEFYDPWEGEEG